MGWDQSRRCSVCERQWSCVGDGSVPRRSQALTTWPDRLPPTTSAVPQSAVTSTRAPFPLLGASLPLSGVTQRSTSRRLGLFLGNARVFWDRPSRRASSWLPARLQSELPGRGLPAVCAAAWGRLSAQPLESRALPAGRRPQRSHLQSSLLLLAFCTFL